MSNLEEKFEEIAQEAIKEAERVKCTFADFVQGLRDIEGTVRERRQAAEEELESQ